MVIRIHCFLPFFSSPQRISSISYPPHILLSSPHQHRKPYKGKPLSLSYHLLNDPIIVHPNPTSYKPIGPKSRLALSLERKVASRSLAALRPRKSRPGKIGSAPKQWLARLAIVGVVSPRSLALSASSYRFVLVFKTRPRGRWPRARASSHVCLRRASYSAHNARASAACAPLLRGFSANFCRVK